MTSTQLAALACDNLTVKTVTELDAAGGAMMAQCMNAALRDYFSALPFQYKQQRLSAVLRGPTAFSTTDWAVVEGSDGVAMYLNGLGNVQGRSFRLDDESSFLNRFVTNRRALFPCLTIEEDAYDAAAAYVVGDKVVYDLKTYICIQNDSGGHTPGTSGGTAYWSAHGTRTGTLYGDAVPFAASNWRLVRPPTIVETGSQLFPIDEPMRFESETAVFFGGYGPAWGGGGIAVGVPSRYILEPADPSAALGRIDERGDTVTPSGAAFFLRVRPLPQQDYRIVMEVEASMQTVTLRDIATPVVLMVHDTHANGVLLPMIRAHLAKTSLWEGDARSREQAMLGLADARRILNDLPTINAPTNSRITSERYF